MRKDVLCPICNKAVARASNKNPGSVKGLLAMHTKFKHPEIWDGRTS
jgi:hypothetical protein